MRLAIINQYYLPDLSPTAKLTASLAEHRAEHGDDVTVITSRGNYQTGDLHRGVQGMSDSNPKTTSSVIVLKSSSPIQRASGLISRAIQYLWFYVWSSLRILWIPKQDVIIALTTPPYAIGIALVHKWLRNWKCQIVLWNMDVYPDILEVSGLIRRRGLLARSLGLLNQFLFRQIDHAICLDTAAAGRLQRYCAKIDCSVIPNWEPAAARLGPRAQPRQFQPAEPESDKSLTILYMGNAGYGHEFESVLIAANQLTHLPVKFLFVGGGPKRVQLERQVAKCGNRNFEFQPYVPDEEKIRLLKQADLGLITLSSEAAGIMSPSKLHSKLAAGLPVIYLGPKGSNVDAAIQKFDCGISLRHDDTNQLVEFITQMINNSHRMAEMSDNAIQAFEDSYCDKATLPQFDRLIKNLSER